MTTNTSSKAIINQEITALFNNQASTFDDELENNNVLTRSNTAENNPATRMIKKHSFKKMSLLAAEGLVPKLSEQNSSNTDKNMYS